MKILSQQKIQLCRKRFLSWYQPRRDQVAAWLAPRREKLLAAWRPLQEKMRVAAEPHLATVKKRWQSLNTREKYTVLSGAVVTAILLFYVLIWSPLDTHLDELRTQIRGEKKTAAWMQAAD